MKREVEMYPESGVKIARWTADNHLDNPGLGFPTLDEILKVAKEEFPGIPLNRLLIYSGGTDPDVIVLCNGDDDGVTLAS